MVLGGEPMDGPRHLWWNFVSSRPERIAQAIRSPGRKTRSWPGPKPSPAISIAPDTV
jgi:hypothetical protein